MGGGSLSDRQLKEFDEYLNNAGAPRPATDSAAGSASQPAQSAQTPQPTDPITSTPPVSQPEPTIDAPESEPEDEPVTPRPAPAPAPRPAPAPAPEPEPESEPEPEEVPEPEATPTDAYESYLDDIIVLHEQKAGDIIDLLDKIDAKSHKDIVADLVDEMQYQKGVIRREQEQADNLKQLLKLAADATKEPS
jgi:outer membrane biosynthesis protein TonB